MLNKKSSLLYKEELDTRGNKEELHIFKRLIDDLLMQINIKYEWWPFVMEPVCFIKSELWKSSKRFGRQVFVHSYWIMPKKPKHFKVFGGGCFAPVCTLYKMSTDRMK